MFCFFKKYIIKIGAYIIKICTNCLYDYWKDEQNTIIFFLKKELHELNANLFGVNLNYRMIFILKS